jgi:hypothetical protein
MGTGVSLAELGPAAEDEPGYDLDMSLRCAWDAMNNVELEMLTLR